MARPTKNPSIYAWKTAPFIRLLLPFTGGIILQRYFEYSLFLIFSILMISGIACFFSAVASVALKYKLRVVSGAAFFIVFAAAGAFTVWRKDIRHNTQWYGHHIFPADQLLIRIDEELTEKAKSSKTTGYVEAVIQADVVIPCSGKLLLYFRKDSLGTALRYGDRIMINKEPQPVRSTGNPGAFNYERYAAFQQLFHTVYLKPNEWLPVPGPHANLFKAWLNSLRQNIVSSLRTNIHGKDEAAIAEALLIGYKEDLDKDLVQAYSNTGVVHIIAISGLHLGLIYVMLLWIFNKIPFIRRSKFLSVLFILACLWLFTLLTGASASVLRSAVMFTFIVLGENLFTKKSGRKASIYNSLAVSALVILVYDPFFLWDVGFQLSYLALISIVSFQKPVYNLIYIPNKWLNKVWELAAVTIAAQILTFPICIFYFHQFPTLFLFSNVIAVPLSSLILFVEILLVAFSWWNFAAVWIGKVAYWLLWLMNKLILVLDELPFAVWDSIHATAFSTWLLYAVVIFCAYWLLKKKKNALKLWLVSMLAFIMLSASDKWNVVNQKKLIVYNVPQHPAIDFIDGNKWQFIGDSILLEDGSLQNFHLKPCRVSLQLTKRVDSLATLYHNKFYLQFGTKRILLIDHPFPYGTGEQKIDVDIIVISGNPKLYISQLANVFNCNQYVFDANNPLWKIDKWKKDCEELHLRHHTVSSQGAFILDCSN